MVGSIPGVFIEDILRECLQVGVARVRDQEFQIGGQQQALAAVQASKLLTFE